MRPLADIRTLVRERIWPGRLFSALALTLVVLALICCVLPLVHNLSYESAALFGVAAGAAAAFLGAWHHSQHGLLIAAFDPPTSPVASWWSGSWRALLLLLAPSLLLALNGLRVGACDPALGAMFWLVITAPSVLLGHGLGWLSAMCCAGHRGRALGLVAGLLLASVAAFLAHLALEPPITGHHLLLGYFSGSIYDEALGLPTSLLAYRAIELGALLGALSLLEGLWRRQQRSGGDMVALARPWRPFVVVGGLALVFALMGWWGRQEWFGVDLDRETIAERLGGVLETEHFVIYYQPQPAEALNLELLARDHEFRYAEMRAFFGTDPVAWRGGQKIRSFVYANREQKGALMGGRRTLVAKLWLGEMHIIWRGLGDHLLAHELAHLFTAPFGSGPLQLSGGLLGVNMGLVEGVAAAADWPAGEMTMHEASAALRRLELAPDIRGLVGASGFWRQAAGRAYTLMGSFVRWLIETRGIERFKVYYATGSVEEAYDGVGSDALVAGWERFLEQEVEVDEQMLALARYLYDRPSIFQKVCPRSVAELRRQVDLAMYAGRPAQARALWGALLALDPENAELRMAFARALLEAGLVEDGVALGEVEALLEAQDSPVMRAQLLELRGDLLWLGEEPEEAQGSYGRCLELGLPADMERRVVVKHQGLMAEAPVARRALRAYLLERVRADVALYFPMGWWMEVEGEEAGSGALAAYLVGRRLWDAQRWEESVGWLEQAVAGLGAEGHARALWLEAHRMLAQSLAMLGQRERAEALFEVLRASGSSRMEVEAVEWLERLAWGEGRGAK